MATSPTLERSVSPRQQHEPARGPASASKFARIPLLCIVFAAGMAMFISIDPAHARLLLALTVLMGLATDGIIRAHPRGEFHTIADTSPYLVVPGLCTLSSGPFREH